MRTYNNNYDNTLHQVDNNNIMYYNLIRHNKALYTSEKGYSDNIAKYYVTNQFSGVDHYGSHPNKDVHDII